MVLLLMIFPAVVGEVIVAVVLEGDSTTGAPKSMRPALWVIATPARALVAPRLLIPTPVAPPHGENRLKNPPLMGQPYHRRLPNSGKSGLTAFKSSLDSPNANVEYSSDLVP